jgi:hypothetical protein
MIKGSLYICDDCCATSCDAEGITNVAGFFSFANPSRFFFSFAKPLDFWFGPSQKGTICSSDRKHANLLDDEFLIGSV